MINRNFKIVFQPYDRSLYGGRRRFGVGAGKLAEYIGNGNAQDAIDRALRSKSNKTRCKYRAHGIIDFYTH